MVLTLCLLFLVVAGIIGLMVFFHHYALGIAQGESMMPYLKNNRPFLLKKKFVISMNEVYLIKVDKEEQYFIKRLTDIRFTPFGKVLLYFTGDNADKSYDSREFGYIRPENVIGKVIKII
jgi:hypothetical protein